MNISNPVIRFYICGNNSTDCILQLYDGINGDPVWESRFKMSLTYWDTGFYGDPLVHNLEVTGETSEGEELTAKVAFRIDKSSKTNNFIAIEIDGNLYLTYMSSSLYGDIEYTITFETLKEFNSSLVGDSRFTSTEISDNSYTTLAYILQSRTWVDVDMWMDATIVSTPETLTQSQIVDAASFETDVKPFLYSGQTYTPLAGNEYFVISPYSMYSGNGPYCVAYVMDGATESQTRTNPSRHLSLINIMLSQLSGYVLSLQRGMTYHVYAYKKIGNIEKKSIGYIEVVVKGSETDIQTYLKVDTLASMGYDVVNKSLLDSKTSVISTDLTEHTTAQQSVTLMYRGSYKPFDYGPHVKAPTEWTNNDPLFLCLDDDGTNVSQMWKALTHEHTLTTTTATEYTITHADYGIDSQYPDVQVVKVSDGTITDVTVSYVTSNNKYATKITFPSAPVSGTEYKVMFRR